MDPELRRQSRRNLTKDSTLSACPAPEGADRAEKPFPSGPSARLCPAFVGRLRRVVGVDRPSAAAMPALRLALPGTAGSLHPALVLGTRAQRRQHLAAAELAQRGRAGGVKAGTHPVEIIFGALKGTTAFGGQRIRKPRLGNREGRVGVVDVLQLGPQFRHPGLCGDKLGPEGREMPHLDVGFQTRQTFEPGQGIGAAHAPAPDRGGGRWLQPSRALRRMASAKRIAAATGANCSARISSPISTVACRARAQGGSDQIGT